MKEPWRRARGVLIPGVIVAVLGTQGPPVAAEIVELEDLDASRVRWSELSYRAKKLTFSARTDLKLQTVASAAAAEEFAEPAEGGGLMAGDAGVALLTMETRGLGQDSLTRIWLSPLDATAFQRDQYDRGKRKRWRAYRYTKDGVAVVTHRPAEGDDQQRRESWSDRSTGFFEYPDWLGSGALVTEPGSIFFVAAAAPLEKAGDRIQVPAFSKNNLLLLELTVEGVDRLRVDYTEVSSSGERKVGSRVEAILVKVDARPLDPDSDENDFELLGLRGDVEVMIDRSTRVPLQMSGRVPVAGRVNVRLQRVVLE